MNILVVEDDSRQADLIVSVLAEDEDGPIGTTVASRFEAACEMLGREPVDAVLLDLNLPDRGALDTLDGIRACTDAAIVVFTGHPHLGEEAMRRGADDYLVKGEAHPRGIRRALAQAAERRRMLKQRKEAGAQHTHLAALGTLALETMDIATLYRETCNRIADGTGLSAGAIYEHTANTLTLAKTRSDASEERYLVPLAPGSRLARQLDSAATFTIDRTAPDEAGLLARLHGDVAIACPIRSADAVVAVLCATPQHVAQMETHRAFVASVANILSVAVQRGEHDFLLQQSREELSTILDAVPGIVARFGEDFRIAYINPAATVRSRQPVSWFVGKCVDEILPADVAAIWKSAIERVFRTGVPEALEVGSMDGAGRYSVSLVREWSGLRPTVISIAFDITARVRAEARFRALYDSDLLGVVFFRPDGVLVDANPWFRAFVGATWDDIVAGRVTWTSLAGDGPPLHDRLREDAGGVLTVEGEIVLADGSRVPAVIGASYTDERRTEAMSFVFDQRPLRLAEQTISEQHLLLDSAPDAILLCSTSGEIRFWSAGATRLYGWTTTDAVGRNAFTLLSPDGAAHDHVAAQALQSGEWTGELRQITKGGNEVIVQSRWARVQHGPSKDALLVISTDITDRKELEAQLMRAQRLESLGTLAGGIAHDLNNILMPILMGAELLRKKVNRPDLEPTLGRIQESAKRAGDLMGQLLMFAKGRHVERELVDPSTLVDEVARIAEQTFPPQIRVLTAVADDVWPLWCDRTQMHQVLLNLTINARDAILPGSGTIVIACENAELDDTFARMLPDVQPGSYSLFRVEDTGEGIPEAIRDRIFDPFFSTKDVGKGTGLGLATSRSIVKNHGGFISVESEANVGTTVYVSLPAAANVRRRTVAEPPRETPEGSGERLLVIEDDESVREIIRATLESSGYRVITAEDGADGVAMFAREQSTIDAVITDVMMPVMDGVATARAIHWLDATMPIVIISGLGTTGRASELQDVPTLLLPKPFTAERLLMTVQQAITRRSSALPGKANRS